MKTSLGKAPSGPRGGSGGGECWIKLSVIARNMCFVRPSLHMTLALALLNGKARLGKYEMDYQVNDLPLFSRPKNEMVSPEAPFLLVVRAVECSVREGLMVEMAHSRQVERRSLPKTGLPKAQTVLEEQTVPEEQTCVVGKTLALTVWCVIQDDVHSVQRMEALTVECVIQNVVRLALQHASTFLSISLYPRQLDMRQPIDSALAKSCHGDVY